MPSLPALQFSNRPDCWVSIFPPGKGPITRVVSTRSEDSTRTTVAP